LEECVDEAAQSAGDSAQVSAAGVDTPEFAATREAGNDVIAA
jgi:hypothetical protein